MNFKNFELKKKNLLKLVKIHEKVKYKQKLLFIYLLDKYYFYIDFENRKIRKLQK